MKTEESETSKFIRNFASIILLLILLALASCHVSNSTSTGDTDNTDKGYIVYESSKILVTRTLDAAGQRTLTKRTWGLDGEHFTAEEEYLTERPSMIADLLSGKTIQFTL